ncbi:MAG: hypothetical protein IJS29_04840 [Selenomonadaceae bacterium]|nr:hypothetical protein [Selenomonadaceae bacterium]
MTIPKSLLKVQDLPLTTDEFFNVINPASNKTRYEEIQIKSFIGGRLPSDFSPSYKQAVLQYRCRRRQQKKPHYGWYGVTSKTR